MAATVRTPLPLNPKVIACQTLRAHAYGHNTGDDSMGAFVNFSMIEANLSILTG